jgi:hypothetical protein
MSLYKKHNYLNREVPYLINTVVKEYDMKSGGYTILKKYGEFSKSEIEYLDSLPKYERNVWIGKRVRENRNLSSVLMDGFTEARRLFFEANDVDENKVLSIKKDALFLVNYPAIHTTIDGFEFQLKNNYSSYYLLNGKEFYFKGKSQELDVKGIGDDVIDEHREYFVKDLINIFTLAEKGNTDYLIKYLRRYRDNYLNRRLALPTYREFNMENAYRTDYDSSLGSIYLESINQGSAINIGYNYIKYIIPLIGYYI